jgi:protein-disulfide isomerase
VLDRHVEHYRAMLLFSAKGLAMNACFVRLAVVLMLMVGIAAPAKAAEPLTTEQKHAVEQVIRDYLMNHPDFLIQVLREAQAKAKQDKEDSARQAIVEKRNELVADKSSPVGGNPDGDVTIVEFFDYRCPYCKQVEPSLEALLKDDPKIRIVYKEFPILGPASLYASRMALAAGKQGKYNAFHTAMMAVKGQITEETVRETAATAGVDVAKAQADMNAPDVEAVLRRNYKLAEALDIQGTPAFIIGDVLTPGAADIESLKKMIASARKPG